MLYARCASQFVEMIFQTRSTLAIENILLLFTHHYPETYKPKFHCRRQSGMNFGYVTENGFNIPFVFQAAPYKTTPSL